MSEIIKINCEVGSVEKTQEQIDAEKLAQAKAEINSNTETTIFAILGVDNREDALVVQANLQAEATAIIFEKAVNGRYPAGGEARITEINSMHEAIKKAITDGKEAKALL